MRTTVSLLVALLGITATSCLGPGDFRCQEHAQCGGLGAFCESDGRCSLPDADCPSQRRYVHRAGGLSDSCVGMSCPANPIRAVSGGGSHACLLRADGGVFCWGRNDDGQLGDGTRTPRTVPVRVLDDAVAVATGERHTCAVRSGGAVLCWGADEKGQLGDGGGDDKLTPAPVAGLDDAVAVAAGVDFSCATHAADGTVSCWGDDTVGQLGDGSAADGLPRRPTAVFGLIGVRAVTARWRHACAVRDDETLWCWGYNNDGQLGDGSRVDQRQPVRVAGLTTVTAAGVGNSHSCAATRASGLYCWGSNGSGQLAQSSDAGALMPARVPIVSDPVGLAVGAQHTCAVRNTGAVLCWGSNGSGQLGDGTTAAFSVPVAVSGLPAGRRLGAGAAFSCAETRDGALFCWGDNHQGQLGAGGDAFRARPGPVADLPPNGARVGAIAAGGGHTCATMLSAAYGMAPDRPYCWGADQAGQLGNNGRTDLSSPEPVKSELRADTISAGATHTCATEGALWCWGRGNAGQLGPGHPPIDSAQPSVALEGLFSAVAAGGAHTCAIGSTGGAAEQLYCFGANSDGQLGDGTTTSRMAAAAVALGTAAPYEIVAGDAHSCALDRDGYIWCWGRGTDGQLGDGSGQSRTTPVKVDLGARDRRAAAIAAGGAHTCARADDDQVWCWGRGAEGQLGTGDTTNALAPVQLTTLGAARSVAAGGAHSCAALSDGTARCWGANDLGQLGDGTTHARPAPTLVLGLRDVATIAAGAAHSCAVLTDGSTTCWGADTSGQLGDGVVLSIGAPQLNRAACE
jgi:alpha-tubulin suppressor-like RCC1 family protein